MSNRSAIEKIPADVLETLETKLIQKDYSTYQSLSVWLKEQGFSIHQSQICIHAKKLKERPKPLMQKIRNDLKTEGVELKCTDESLERLLIKLGALRLKENLLMTKLLNKYG